MIFFFFSVLSVCSVCSVVYSADLCNKALCSHERASSYPYLSGDTWRFFADWRLSREEGFDPRRVRLGDTIFVEYPMLKRFSRKYLPKISNRFVLITPNCEEGTDNPQPGRYAFLLENKKLAVWFVQNIDREATERLVPIPIGLANQVWDHGQVSVLAPIVEGLKKERNLLVYVNFSVWTNPKVRGPCMDYFKGLAGTTVASERNFGEYLTDLAQTVFAVSPPGNGLDCHRTWEALLMGCYPIVKNSTLNPLYEGLPVVRVDEWSEVTEEFLSEKREELKSYPSFSEKLYAPYWFEKVRRVQKELRDHPTLSECVYQWLEKCS